MSAPDRGLGSDQAPPPLVVLVPGLGLDARSLALVRRRLLGASLVVPLPSMGMPAGRGLDLRVERQSRRLVAALPPGRRVVLVGHSASCPVVVEAATLTSAVAGLVLVGPVTDPDAVSWPGMLFRWLLTARHEQLWELRVLAPQYRRTGVLSMARGMNHMRRYRTDAGLSTLSLPTLIIRGQHDRIAPAPWCDRLAVTPRTVVTSVPAAAHMVPLTHPHVVAEAADRLRSDVAERAA